MVKKNKQEPKLKQEATQYLGEVPREYVFRCCDGRILKNLPELAEALNSMNDETFAYHVNIEKNDFCTWVRDIIGDNQLVDVLANSPNREKAADQVDSRITVLTRILTS